MPGATPGDQALVQYLLDSLDAPRRRALGTPPDASRVQEPGPRYDYPGPGYLPDCTLADGPFSPEVWNAEHVVRLNNCYNYASNRITNTFAQPGRGAGQTLGAMTCPYLNQGAYADGCMTRSVCYSPDEEPRELVALVVAPGFDFHWYRRHDRGGSWWWGHKVGIRPASIVDNSGLEVITDPETCDRGPYTDFCAYYYTTAAQRNRIA